MPGGQGTTYRAGDIILKPVLDSAEAEWLASVLDRLSPSDGIRIIKPLPARDGRWVVDGWSAWEHLEGTVRAGAWREALDVSDLFHAAVATVPRSHAIANDHPWAIGDAFAWGEQNINVPSRFAGVFDALKARRRPVDLPSQLIHSDIFNNILFHAELPPAVIDISPRWRPKGFADAIAVIDAIGWFGAGHDAMEALRKDIGEQMAVRAALFRLGSAVVLFEGDDDRLAAEVEVYERIVAVID